MNQDLVGGRFVIRSGTLVSRGDESITVFPFESTPYKVEFVFVNDATKP
jgi:hypothetical protein